MGTVGGLEKKEEPDGNDYRGEGEEHPDATDKRKETFIQQQSESETFLAKNRGRRETKSVL